MPPAKFTFTANPPHDIPPPLMLVVPVSQSGSSVLVHEHVHACAPSVAIFR